MTRESYQCWYELHSDYRLFPSTNIITPENQNKTLPVRVEKADSVEEVLSELKDHYSFLLNVMMIYIKETALHLGDIGCA